MFHSFREPFIMDFGASPLIVNIESYTRANKNFRTALWTGQYMQVTLMTLAPGESIGLERHGDLDQLIKIESGKGLVEMGQEKNALGYKRYVDSEYAVIIPAGFWHNLTNVGTVPLKLFSVYAPPTHPFGTVHKTKEEAEMLEK